MINKTREASCHKKNRGARGFYQEKNEDFSPSLSDSNAPSVERLECTVLSEPRENSSWLAPANPPLYPPPHRFGAGDGKPIVPGIQRSVLPLMLQGGGLPLPQTPRECARAQTKSL